MFPIETSIQLKEVQQDIGTIRASTGLLITVTSLIMSWLIASLFVSDHALHSARIHVISSSLLYNVFPLMIIFRSPKINEYCKSKWCK